MGTKLALARQLVSELLKPASSLDEFALIQASDRPVILSGFVAAPDALQTQVASTQSRGRTALLDAIYLGLEYTKTGRNGRKVLLVVSDGGDNISRYTETEIQNAIRETGVRVYAIGITEAIAGRGRTAEEVAGPALLLQLAEHAGGRHFDMERVSNLPQMALEISTAMRARR